MWVIMHSYYQSEQQNPLQWIDFMLTTKEKKKKELHLKKSDKNNKRNQNIPSSEKKK